MCIHNVYVYIRGCIWAYVIYAMYVCIYIYIYIYIYMYINLRKLRIAEQTANSDHFHMRIHCTDMCVHAYAVECLP